MTQCPHHPGRMECALGNCRECDREAAATDHHAHIAAVRAAIAAAPPPPHTDRPKEQS